MRLIEHFHEQVSRLLASGDSTEDLQRARDEYNEELTNNEDLGVISKSYYQGALKAIDVGLLKRCNENEVEQ